MRRALVVLLIFLVALPVFAGEIGVGVILSWGTSKVPFQAPLILKEEGTCRVLPIVDGAIYPTIGSGIYGQIGAVEDCRVDQSSFRFYWSTSPTPGDNDWVEAKYIPQVGWTFQINPEQLIPGGIWDTQLHLMVVQVDGERRYIRLPIGSIGRHSDVRSHEFLCWIRPVAPVPKPEPIAPAVTTKVVADPTKINTDIENLGQAVATLDRNQQKLATVSNVTSDRVGTLEGKVQQLSVWADSVVAASQKAAAQSAPTTPTTWTLQLPPAPVGWAVWTSDGRNAVGPVRVSGVYQTAAKWIEVQPWGESWKSWHKTAEFAKEVSR